MHASIHSSILSSVRRSIHDFIYDTLWWCQTCNLELFMLNYSSPAAATSLPKATNSWLVDYMIHGQRKYLWEDRGCFMGRMTWAMLARSSQQKTPMWIRSKFVVLPPSSYDHLQNGMSTESRLTLFDLNQWISTKVRKLGSSFSSGEAKNGLA